GSAARGRRSAQFGPAGEPHAAADGRGVARLPGTADRLCRRAVRAGTLVRPGRGRGARGGIAGQEAGGEAGSREAQAAALNSVRHPREGGSRQTDACLSNPAFRSSTYPERERKSLDSRLRGSDGENKASFSRLRENSPIACAGSHL